MVGSLKTPKFFASAKWQSFFFHPTEDLSSRDMTRDAIRGPVFTEILPGSIYSFCLASELLRVERKSFQNPLFVIQHKSLGLRVEWEGKVHIEAGKTFTNRKK